jgi:hypothetical protein
MSPTYGALYERGVRGYALRVISVAIVGAGFGVSERRSCATAPAIGTSRSMSWAARG